ncbi:UDP-N-acetyl-D-mannosamine dehydrogenase [Sinorhizobium sp. 8-89]|uniref:UDP-N-acetyl-D-mannosamine dehydrogenase n=1 Tax=Sinorhizobium sp. 7-81 TaxID=3049087 RepID=UPI0024C2FBB8|nr:UDP-N-acetyl-D-mannosamine dehydrogenase [Sinorhizobium sp. 7-81]MDK1389768.1 UDP-N-acetyl-D-mannosamine dehydrogenase [Sinorhizobium sp. 7-81]
MPQHFINKTISIIGLGYIGLPSAAAFAARGVKVIGVDVNQETVDIINQGKIHIVEPELDMVVHAAVTEGYLRATTIPEPAEAFLLAVPTPFRDGHEPDLSFIEAASKAIAPVLKKGDLVILESTSPVGTTEQMAAWLAEERPDLSFPQDRGEESDIRIAHCPERVLPGHVLRELVENDRVIGGLTGKCSEAAVALYKVFVQGECIVTDARTAEMCKLTENASRDVSIAFANELSLICDKLDIDVWELIKLANRHPRVNILQPGPGVGGHCIAVDPWFIVNKSPEESRLIRTARLVNDSKPHWVEAKVHTAVAAAVAKDGCHPSSVKIACMGLSFKPDIDDLRESPALEIALRLADKYPEQIYVVEPNIDALPADLAKRGARLSTQAEALEIADVVIMLVDHKEFKERVPVLRDGALLVDTRGIWRVWR